MAERVYLDPSELTTRTELDLTDFISSEGIDWGDAAVVNSSAQQTVGSMVVDFTIPNRAISIPLHLKSSGGTTFAAIRSAVQTKVGLWQAQGGYIRRVLSTGSTVFCDVVSAQLHLGGDWLQAHSDVDTNAAITLEAIPDFYAAEETLSDHTETTLPELTFTETTANGGDFPLGDRVRIVVDDDEGQNQRGLIWAFRGRHYSSATTAASAYQAEALEPLDTATKVAKVGASGGTVVTHGTLATNWTPVLGTNLGGSTYLTHQGTHRVFARVFTSSGTTVQTRFVWDVGDLVYPSENDAVRCYDGGTFHIIDYGEVRLDPPPSGTYRWGGQIQAKGDAGTENFSVDRVWVVNADESFGIGTAPPDRNVAPTVYTVRDEFSRSGTLSGSSATVGGTWSAGGTSLFLTNGTLAYRAAISDPSFAIAYVGSNVTACAVQGDVEFTSTVTPNVGLLARYVDTSNYLYLLMAPSTSLLRVVKLIGGVATTLGSYTSPFLTSTTATYTVRLIADAAGNWSAAIGADGGPVTTLISGYDATLATGGVLASGKVGLVDLQDSPAANIRTFDNFLAWTPTADAAIYANRSAEVNTLGVTRQDTSGTAYGPMTSVVDALPRIPNRSSAGTVEGFVKASRGEFATLADPGIDNISARVYRRASYLLVP